ncbi:PepSY domain-containing protein [Bradyrhizobium sp. 83012]|uniref:PepSY domain-containing protein n=1 Tax=Bradyrhizobium aeschynomenes TaxID=2734909 RepID=A0ABX2CMU0_9BRAD|nr:PepSY domain-containing protein [Bradyrhizobium aeschynomenes]NPU09316.1 PepSY domain-containing protein [Bradyrhizobium aeschynomenes]NPU69253.1 PepSY domain-containing protein [Bradyrhizobium aeschynomenes]NPV20636.1 PepSY domain-containing protein [Bradyrhizobium aeschynomenes]
MRRSILLTLILLSWTSLAHAVAGASATDTPEASSSQAPSDPALSQVAIDRELERFRRTEVSLHQALRIAEKIHPGSRTADISFEGGLDAPVYKVRTLQSGQIWESDIDGSTAKVLNTVLFSTVQGLSESDRSSLAALTTVSLKMSDAIRIAERSAAGKAISGGLISKDGKLAFIVVVVSGKDLKQVTLEPTSMRRR